MLQPVLRLACLYSSPLSAVLCVVLCVWLCGCWRRTPERGTYRTDEGAKLVVGVSCHRAGAGSSAPSRASVARLLLVGLCVLSLSALLPFFAPSARAVLHFPSAHDDRPCGAGARALAGSGLGAELWPSGPQPLAPAGLQPARSRVHSRLRFRRRLADLRQVRLALALAPTAPRCPTKPRTGGTLLHSSTSLAVPRARLKTQRHYGVDSSALAWHWRHAAAVERASPV